MTFYNVKNLSYLLQQDCSVVITGDSLAYNRYDFVEESRMNAWDCPVAMKSWSFLLRDYLITHSRGWTDACQLELVSENLDTQSFKNKNQSLTYQNQLPLEDSGIVINAETDTDIALTGCPEHLCFVTHPSKIAIFKNSESADNLIGSESLFGGVYFKWLTNQGPEIRNVKMDSHIQFAGAADVKTEVFLTGSGSKTAEWLLENIQERILKHKPNLCVMIIGANNRRMKDPKSFEVALNEIIHKLRACGSEILLISPPHSSTTDPQWGEDNIYYSDDAITKPIIEILCKAASEYNLPYIDLFDFFSGIPNDIWRFDNTHFTKEGNLMLFEAVRDNFFKEL